MSTEIVCPTCGASNGPGSRYCNNCGGKLPESGEIICPRCATANPSDRLFCDNCGARLVEKHTTPVEEPGEESPSPAGKEAFSLPMREPGEIGDIDPSKIPDWLTSDESDETPKLEDLTPAKKAEDELPDWLVHDSDNDPIINAPTSISTEFYQDLVDHAEDQLEPDDLNDEANEANLPDWLADADDPAPMDQTPDNLYDDEEETPEIPDWLAEMDAEPADKATPVGKEARDSGSDGDETTPDEAETVGAEAGEPGDDGEDGGLTAWLGDLDNIAKSSAIPSTGDSPLEMDDLLAELQIDDAAEPPATDTGWLSELGSMQNEIETEPPETSPEIKWPGDEPEEEEKPTPAAEDSEGLTSWLSDLSDISDSSDSAKEDAEEQIDIDGLLDEDEKAQSAEEPLPEWLADLGPAQTDLFSRDKEDTEIEPAGGTPDWMDALGPLETNLLREEGAGIAEDADDVEDDVAAAESADEAADLAWVDNGEETFSTLFEIGPSEEPLPDWLADVAEEGSMYVGSGQTGPLDKELSESLSSAADAGAEDLDWLLQTGRLSAPDVESPAEETAVPPSTAEEEPISPLMAEEEPAAPLMAEEEPITPPAAEAAEDLEWAPSGEELDEGPLDEMPDWLSDLRAIETGELHLEPDAAPVESEVIPPAAAAEELEAEDTAAAEADEETAVPAGEDMHDSAFFDSSEALEEMPDWIGQLDAVAPDAEDDEEPPLMLTEDLPDWIANMRPSEGMISSSLPGLDQDQVEEDFDTLEGIPDDFAGADLPEWLRDVGIAAEYEPGTAKQDEIEDFDLEIPAWLQEEDEVPVIPELDEEEFSEQIIAAATEDWGAFIHDLPPADPLAESVPESDLPEWVLALKPPELKEDKEGGEQPVEEPVEEAMLLTNSPLLGIRQVIAIEPAISMPRVARPMSQLEISAEQMQQAALLRQIISQQTPKRKISPVSSTPGISMGVRSLLALLLLVAALLGLRGPFDIVDLSKQPVPAYAAAMNDALAAAAGAPVLVAIDYTPSLAGELTAPAQLVIDALTANGSPIILTSQQAAGTAVAADLVTDETIWGGYLPGEAMGLRQLGNCAVIAEACTHIGGKPFDPALQDNLSDLALIVVVTGDREILVNWIEQVGMAHDLPIVAGLTGSLAPIAAPYYATGQLSGYLGGMTDTAVYANTYTSATQPDMTAIMNAQLISQLLVVLLLLTGLFTYGLKGSSAKQDDIVLPAPE